MNPVSRREFISRTVLASTAGLAGGSGILSSHAIEKLSPPIVVFSKIYQTLNLNAADGAMLTAQAGLDGHDVPVRVGGEVEPEHAAEELPIYHTALLERGLKMPLITTGITSVSSPNAEQILRTAKQLGVKFYRIGFIDKLKDAPVEKQLSEAKAQLKDLAAMNKQIGIGGLVQNHSPSGHLYLGGDLGELRELTAELPPEQMGIAFDIGHALIVHGDQWRSYFDKLKSHLKVAYVKDAKRSGGWFPFGQGDVGKSGYFSLLKELNYSAPISLHIEFDWSDNGKSKTREQLVRALKASSQALRQWLAAA